MLKSLRIAAALVALSGPILSGPALAESGRLTVAGYAGSFEILVRAEVIPAFEKKFGVRVDYLAGNSDETLSRLQAQKGHSPIDVAIVDDGTMYRAIRQGFCSRIDGLAADDLYASARFEDDKAVALGLVATGLMYNVKVFREEGWAAPQSWNDLKDSKYRKRLIVPPVTQIYGLHALVMLARLNGGGEGTIEPGFRVMKEQVMPNALTRQDSPDLPGELLRQGKAALMVWGSGKVQATIRAGLAVDFVYPKEGAVSSFAAACPVARANASPLAAEFVKALLAPNLQLMFLKDYGYGPVSKSIAVPPELARIVPTAERAAALLRLDWDAINAQRDAWDRRWVAEYGR